MSVAICESTPIQKRSHIPRGPRCGLHRVSALTQALDLKDVAYQDGTASETPVHVKAALMRAWVDLQEVVMALRGQGKPKPVEARNAQPKRKPRSAGPVGDATPRARERASDSAPSVSSPAISDPASDESAPTK
jgi:hypothetical protein